MKKETRKKTTFSASKNRSKKAENKPVKLIKKIIKRILRPKPQAEGRLQVQKLRRQTRKPVAPKPVYLSPKAPTIPSAKSEAPSRPDHRIPDYYSEDRLVLLTRDPWWIFAYWEVTPSREKEVLWMMPTQEAGQAKKVLRVYDVTESSVDSPRDKFDIELNDFSSSWYIDTGEPGREWMAEIGYLTAGGKFYALVRSNRIKTPHFGLSDVLDEEWLMPDGLYQQLLMISGGIGNQGGSLEVRALLEKYLRQMGSSGNMSTLATTKSSESTQSKPAMPNA